MGIHSLDRWELRLFGQMGIAVVGIDHLMGIALIGIDGHCRNGDR